MEETAALRLFEPTWRPAPRSRLRCVDAGSRATDRWLTAGAIWEGRSVESVVAEVLEQS